MKLIQSEIFLKSLNILLKKVSGELGFQQDVTSLECPGTFLHFSKHHLHAKFQTNVFKTIANRSDSKLISIRDVGLQFLCPKQRLEASRGVYLSSSVFT